MLVDPRCLDLSSPFQEFKMPGENRPMNVFVTGSSGFVGRAVVRRFLKNNWKVTALVHPAEMDRFPFQQNERLNTVVAELNDVGTKLIPPESVIVHLAAKVHTVPKTETERQDFFQVNRDGTIHLAEAAKRCGATAFVFVSTSGVYGDLLSHRTCSENDEPQPRTPYTKSKHEAEVGLLAMQSLSFPIVILRPSVMFGPGDRGNFRKMFRMLYNGFIVLPGKAKAKKSILYVEDLAATIEFAASRPECFKQRIYNVAAPEPYTMLDMIADVEKTTRKKSFTLTVPTGLLRLPCWCGDVLESLLRVELLISTRKLQVIQSDARIDVSRLAGVLEGHWMFRTFKQGFEDYVRSGESPWSPSILNDQQG